MCVIAVVVVCTQARLFPSFMMAGRKRNRDATDQSPIKTGKKNSHIKYFTGQLSDGKRCMRLVSFDPKLRPRLNDSFGDSSPVAIKECRVKRASVGDDLEIVGSARR